jgi:hypothetical protein
MINKTFNLLEDIAGFEPVRDIKIRIKKLIFNSFM